jgi:hypothetical protein
MMLDQEALVAVLVAGVAHLRLEVLATLQRHLLMVETAHLHHQGKEIMEEAAQVKHPHQQEVGEVLML